MSYPRGTFAAALLASVLLAGCSASVSHPSALGSATGAAASAPSTVAPGAVASTPSQSANISGTSASPAVSVPAQQSPGDIATPSPSDIATPSPSDIATPSPSDIATPSPINIASLSSSDIANVRATTREFIDDFNIALTTGNVTKIEALTSTSCGCRSLVSTIKQLSAKNERFDGVAFTLKSIDRVTALAAGASAAISYSVSAGSIVDRAGKQVGTSDPTPDAHADVFVINVDGRWMVRQNILLGLGRA